MTSHSERKILPYRADQMYELVADVEKYPSFIPWCVALRVRNREIVDELELLTADMAVAFKVFREQFTSRVSLDPGQNFIEVQYIDGPFRYLTNRWAFENNNEGGCTVDFFIDFEFRSKTLQKLMSQVFTKAVLKMVGAFEDRAHVLYRDAHQTVTAPIPTLNPVDVGEA